MRGCLKLSEYSEMTRLGSKNKQSFMLMNKNLTSLIPNKRLKKLMKNAFKLPKKCASFRMT
jgi:hypothetical protein